MTASSNPEPTGHAQPAVKIHERPARVAPGVIGILAMFALLAGSVVLLVASAGYSGQDQAIAIIGGSAALLAFIVVWSGLVIVRPGTSKVLIFFGNYIGTVRRTGLCLSLPLVSRDSVSLRVRNFETKELKVNDADGNPVQVAAIIVWQVTETAQASFAVDKYKNFVEVQSEAALRHVVMKYPYDGADTAITLRGSTSEVSTELAAEVVQRVAVAGVEIIEVRISKLSYAPEIAESMLRRQQAGAIIAARERIVEGAVSVVSQALAQLEAEGTIKLDDERRAAMVSNLLVVLTSDQPVSPVINSGTLYT
ncbi:MAG: SPFH domain-containing protein [Bifidobacteriaceae bacterium]|jgi:regulator of protease activity HflC (stomatin/prohibitin superfamily)|nr:SPFH domain-containing protein [Bifidobacteriaceae bacterium]